MWPGPVCYPALEVPSNMKWPNNRFLLLPYFVVMMVLVTIGCTSKEDPDEVLLVSGNHSTGDLVMVTTFRQLHGHGVRLLALAKEGGRE